MTPTKAQIDAAAKAVCSLLEGRDAEWENYRTFAKVALTAAAENEPNRLCVKCAAEITHNEESGVTEARPRINVPKLNEKQLKAIKEEWDKGK